MSNEYVINTPKYPFSIGWAITNRCNLNCIHCNMNSGKSLINELSMEQCFKIIDELNENNVQKITFFGGEPLMRKDFFEIANYAFNKGIFINMTTNGLLITKDMVLKELYKFEIIRISLDGPTPDLHEFIRNKKDTFRKTIENIQLLVNNGIDVGVVTCVSHKNINSLAEMAKLLSNLKVKKWFLPLLSPSGRGSNIAGEALSPKEVEKFLIDIKEITKNYSFSVDLDIPYSILLKKEVNNKITAACPAAISEMVIFANGDVSPCCQIPIIGGNVLESTIYDIWNNSDVFKKFRDRSLIKGNCGKCKYLMSCGGCRANAYIKYGDYLQGDDVCWKR